MSDPKHYPDYLLDTSRVYSPRMLPSAAHSRWVGKPVTVVWQQPVFSLSLENRHGQPGWDLIRWYGYVVELDKQIPSDELPKKDMRVQPKKRTK
jgi:hypothetical protein